MNEFEWRRQLRDLRQSHAPGRNLWSSIDAALDQDARRDSMGINPRVPHGSSPPLPARGRRWLVAASAVAALLLVVGLGWRSLQPPVAAPIASTTPTQVWKPSDPRLSGAAIELDAARMELQLALQQAPDSPALQRLLDRTELQQTQLRQHTRRAG